MLQRGTLLTSWLEGDWKSRVNNAAICTESNPHLFAGCHSRGRDCVVAAELFNDGTVLIRSWKSSHWKSLFIAMIITQSLSHFWIIIQSAVPPSYYDHFSISYPTFITMILIQSAVPHSLLYHHSVSGPTFITTIRIQSEVPLWLLWSILSAVPLFIIMITIQSAVPLS